jgi:deoxyribose-phosphate aldolase
MPVDVTLASRIDHTLLRPDAVAAEIDQLCAQALQFGFHAVCVQPTFVARVARRLAGSAVAVATVAAFPHGAATTDTKVFEARRAVADGATEVDMVANLGWLRDGLDTALADDGAAVVAACPGVAVKVILETALFADPARKQAAARAALAAGAAFVKTSTGFGPGGATVEDVALLRAAVGERAGVKASGGIRTREQALALVAAGANRIGASSSAALVTLPDR